MKIRKQIFSEYLNSNYKKINLLKNFNHVIKEIIEKDLNMTLNSETMGTLKKEYLSDLPWNSQERENQFLEDKENINQANIAPSNKTRHSEEKKTLIIKKNDLGDKKKYNNTRSDNYNYQKFENFHTNNQLRVKHNSHKNEGYFSYTNGFSANRIPTFQNRNFYYNKKEGLPRTDWNSSSVILKENKRITPSQIQEKSIY